MSHFSGKNVWVTGGASFIGSRLVESLLREGARVTVLDDFSTGSTENLETASGELRIVQTDLSVEKDVVELFSTSADSVDIVFHLAAIHGGRGFIESKQALILRNLKLDFNVFRASIASGVGMVVHASSACVYPINLQAEKGSRLLLKEEQANFEHPEGSFPDGVYGWVKLMGEFQLSTLLVGTASKGRSARIFTAYGERENESHAAVALTAKALLRQEPFEIWGDGMQTRNFTYVEDTVRGLMALGADSSDPQFDVFNVGTSNHVTVLDFVERIFSTVGWRPDELQFQSSKPTGVGSRASDNSKFMRHFGWEPSIPVEQGIERLVNWYSAWPSRAQNLSELEQRL